MSPIHLACLFPPVLMPLVLPPYMSCVPYLRHVTYLCHISMTCSPHSHRVQGRGAQERKRMQRKSEAIRKRANQRAIEGERETRRRQEGSSERLGEGKRRRKEGASDKYACVLPTQNAYTHTHTLPHRIHTHLSKNTEARLQFAKDATDGRSHCYACVCLHPLYISSLPHPSILNSKASTLKPADPMPVFVYARSMHLSCLALHPFCTSFCRSLFYSFHVSSFFRFMSRLCNFFFWGPCLCLSFLMTHRSRV